MSGRHSVTRDVDGRSAIVIREMRVPSDRFDIDAELVRRLVADQHPEWATLPIRRVALSGWDNRTFHLGDEMLVRLLSAPGYAGQVEKEQAWLPWLAPRLPLPIPAPVAIGMPTTAFPYPWSIYRWLPGEPANAASIAELPRFASDLAAFLAALQRIDASAGAIPDAANGFRGGPLAIYDAETRRSITALALIGLVDAPSATAVWEAALAAIWSGPPVWVHGDVAVGNLLVQEGALSAVIDFGCCAVGDSACDTVIAWNRFAGGSRVAFQAALPLDDATWERGRGWALWKALITVAGALDTVLATAAEARRIVAEVLADHRSQQ